MQRLVVALGGNALLRRGEPMTAVAQRINVRAAAKALAAVAMRHQLVISHGNGPQVGLLALQNPKQPDKAWPLDVLDAETEGMVGYILEQELGNVLPEEQPLATLLTMVEVDGADPAFSNPTKFIGPQYAKEDADRLAAELGWTFKLDGKLWRRVVASPKPLKIIEDRPIRWLLERGTIVICAGGGGIPTVMRGPRLDGIEAVVDKDLASSLLARQLDADALVMLTDVDSVYMDYGKPGQRSISRASPADLEAIDFPAGSMGPKIEAACEFARAAGKRALIGGLADLEAILEGRRGTEIVEDAKGIAFR
ncbi:Aspartate/glutamate/uridylate kinase [Hyaloraphidium curvatum]|nr:Aspartate/glutamate/uridylate kinase [Hyaloraphidium curvatum]